LILVGALIIGLSAARLATGWAPGRGWLLFEAASWAAGAVLVQWGWSRLRPAKAARPDLSWPQFLRDDLIALGIVVALLGALLALPPATREDLIRSLWEVAHRLHIVRGGP
jgi:hypothetical protein